MVRLKHGDGIDIRQGCSKFQFQYGTIKAFLNAKQRYKDIIFQFQYGTIKAL